MEHLVTYSLNQMKIFHGTSGYSWNKMKNKNTTPSEQLPVHNSIEKS